MLVGLLTLSACTTAPGSRAPSAQPAGASAPWQQPAPPTGTVQAMGTVMDVDGDVQLCLGPVAESYPPRCTGVPMTGWQWEGVDGMEQSGSTRWGAYGLTGTFDGDAFTVTEPPVLLALLDPAPLPDPVSGASGDASEARLLAVESQLTDRLGTGGELLLSSVPDRGYLWVDVVWDDGSLQQAADADFGTGVVIVRSALRPLSGVTG